MGLPSIKPLHENDLHQLDNSTDSQDNTRHAQMDMNIFIEMHKKNLKAMAVINQATFEGLELFVLHQIDLIQRNLEELLTITTAGTIPSEAENQKMQQAENSRQAIELGLAKIRDTSVILAKSNSHVIETISNRITDGLKELGTQTST